MGSVEPAVIGKVVNKGLCCGCGVCAGVCPDSSLKMGTDELGDLKAMAVKACSRACGICESVCPFIDGDYDPRILKEKLRPEGPDAQYHDDVGWYLDSLSGQVADPERRRRSASGGLATWCLEKLFDAGEIDKAAVVGLAEDGSGDLFSFKIIGRKEEVIGSSGSIYCPVEISEIVRRIAEGDERWAVVGVPCLCAALRRASPIRGKVRYLLGLTCGMYQNRFYTELLLSKSISDNKKVSAINFRKRSAAGSARDYGFQAVNADGVDGTFIPYKGFPAFLGRHAYFRTNACNFCADVFAEAADVSFMDAWLPGFMDGNLGTSLVCVRNKRIQEIFLTGGRDVVLNQLPIEDIASSQRETVRRKRYLLDMRMGDPSGTSMLDRLDWRLQSYTQRRSKSIWAGVGRRYGSLAFGLIMLPLAFCQRLLSFNLRMIEKLNHKEK